jgi:LuxR family maltose regulon positive regulatory protein
VSERYDSVGIDITEYIRVVERAFLSIPANILEQYPRLAGHCFVVSLLTRPLSDTVMWADILEKQAEKGIGNRADAITAAFERAVDPRYSSWHVPKQFERIRNTQPEKAGRPFLSSPSLNFPFFHKGQRDYTDISEELDKFIAEFKCRLEPVAGPLVRIMAALIESGICYERGELSKAGAIIEPLINSVDNLSPELRFCVYTLYIELRQAQGEKAEPGIIGDMIENTGAHYLTENYRAFTTNILLDSGDKSAADEWLERQKPVRSVRLQEAFRLFTTARAMMAGGKIFAAEKLLEELAGFSWDHRRNADYIEALTLRAICLWRISRTKEAVQVFTPAITRAAQLQLTMPIVKNGGGILPVLQKILNRLKYGYDADIIDKTFVNLLFIQAREQAGHRPGAMLFRA